MVKPKSPAAWLKGEWMRLTKHRFIPPDPAEKWADVIESCYHPRYCDDCGDVLDVTEDRVCQMCDHHQWCLDRPGAHDWEIEA
jgi:hypothetical protein